ncbi:RNA polymerase II subunit A C-terminal domain phosphatase isoform X2 [Trichomycterus rosablanca]|uniref:RNA polymerase II subunit A C-terminal domain phosphatase isoform X2 n=1 Tax=Trichomycterus rosablanca TaxID=2290929 RepID=UPI002F35C01B
MEDLSDSGGGSSAHLGPVVQVTEVRLPLVPCPMRLVEWKVKPGALVNVDSVVAVCVAIPTKSESGSEERGRTKNLPERKVKSDRAGVVRELCYELGQIISSGDVIAKIEECSHPIVMKGLCAECGLDLTQLQSRNGKQQVPVSTAMVSIVHSVPELMVSSEQAEQLGREDQKRLHRNRKLVLMVDLDQTLIHTTEQHCQRLSSKGIFHFRLGRGEPMLHTRLRPYCKEFLEKISKMYELHVFTLGSRLYAHTIAGFLDPEKKLFSHRILSRDECIDPFSKTGNLREDVWKFAPNLVTVKKYVYFKGTGDINAPPGSPEVQMAKKTTGNFSSQPVESSDSSKTLGHDEKHSSGKPGFQAIENEEQLSKTRTLKQTKLDKHDCSIKSVEGNETEEALFNKKESLSDLDNSCADKKEAETESQNSENSGVNMGEESLDHSMVDEEEENDTDQDDHLIYLEEILTRIHKEYFLRYESYIQGECTEVPDIRKIVPELKSKTLSGTTIVFSGLYPTNYPMERTRESYHAKTLGAIIGKSLVLDAKDPSCTTHLIAARAGTEKVRQAQACKHLHVVNPDWLWECLERWERVEEKLFPLKESYNKSQRSNSPIAFPDVQEIFPAPVMHPVLIQSKVSRTPEVRTYDAVTGKLIRRTAHHLSCKQPQSTPVTHSRHEEHFNLRHSGSQQQGNLNSSGPEDEQPGLSRRKRQPSMSETLPLYTLCKEDLDSMDKEVNDILGEESDNESDEKGHDVRVRGEDEDQSNISSVITIPGDHQQALGTFVEDTRLTLFSDDISLTEKMPRGHKRKLQEAKKDEDVDDNDVQLTSQHSKDSNEDEGSSSEADEMAAALEAELNDFM